MPLQWHAAFTAQLRGEVGVGKEAGGQTDHAQRVARCVATIRDNSGQTRDTIAGSRWEVEEDEV